MFDFKFEIGDDVFFANTVRESAAMNTAEKKKYTEARPQRFTVVERHVQQCYGGLQRHYDLRGVGVVGSMEMIVGISGVVLSNGYIRATEHELVAVAAALAAPEQP